MRVYLASWFSSKDLIKARAEELRAVDIEVTSNWLEEKADPKSEIKDISGDIHRETAAIDIQDILDANAVVLHVPTAAELTDAGIPVSSWARGGRHFESGFQYATMLFFHFLPNKTRSRGSRQLIIVGHKENVFHYLDGVKRLNADGLELPKIKQFDNWELAKIYLLSIADVLKSGIYCDITY